MAASLSQNTATPSPLTAKRRVALIAALFGGIFVGTFDQTFVVTILPQMMGDLDIAADRIGDATWIVNGYLIGYVLALPTLGRAADVYGRIRVYVAASAVFAIGTAAVAVAPTLTTVSIARAISAVGGGALVPIGLAIAADTVDERRRPLVLGLLLAGQNASSLAGPIWGAALEDIIGWRGIFWLNIPLLAPALFVVVRLGRGSRPAAATALDATGIAIFVAALLALTLTLSDDPSAPRPLLLSLAMGALGLTLVGAFVAWERRSRFPMIDVSLFRRPPVVAANVAYLLIGAALIVALVTVPLMRNTLFGGTTIDGAVAVIGLLIALPIGGVVGGLIAPAIGYRATAFAGLSLAVAGFLWMHGWRDVISSIEMWPALICVGLGLGLCDAPLVATVVENAKPQQRAAATGMILVLWTIGMIVGLALLGSRGLGRFEERAAGLFADQGITAGSPEYLAAIHTTYNEILLATAVALAIAALATLFLRRGERSTGRWFRVPGLL